MSFKMRLTTSFLFFSSLLPAIGQQVSFGKARLMTLRTAFARIEETSKYTISYNTSLVKASRVVKITKHEGDLFDILAALLKQCDYTYETQGNYILVKPIDKEKARLGLVRTVKGHVADKNGEPLAGVYIKDLNSDATGVSDTNGDFSLSLLPNAHIELSYIGYKTQWVNAGTKTSVNVILYESVNELEEVVSVGYGSMKKRDLTSAISQLKGNDIQSLSVANPIQALQGRTAGLVVSSDNGSPEGVLRVRVRGANSILSNNDPIYIIDGIPSDVSFINTGDIESVEVLKDASATAIYGSRGANGVVLITTRSGKEGRTHVSYDGSVSLQSLIKKLDMLDARGYCELVNLQQTNDTGKPYFTDDQILNHSRKSYDWQDIAYRHALAMNHNIIISGGSADTKFLVSGSVNGRNAIVSPGNYTRYILRGNFSHNITRKLNLGLTAGYLRRCLTESGSTGISNGGSYFGADVLTPPTVGPYNDDGSWRDMTALYPFSSSSIINLVNYRESHRQQATANNFILNASLTWQPFTALALKSVFGYINSNVRHNNYTTSEALNESNSATFSTHFTDYLISENTATWNHTFGTHKVSIMGGLTFQTDTQRGAGASASGFISDTHGSYDLSAADTYGIPHSEYSKWVMLSYLARTTYSYKNRYLATATFRADGSSRYSKGDKWGFFPSFSLAWRVSGEAFMRSFSWIDDLKLRASYGSTGSTAISPYATLNLLETGKTPIGESGTSTYYAVNNTLPYHLKWETTDQINIGIDAILFGQHMNISLDWYHKLTRNLLNRVHLPSSTGYVSTVRNIGKIQNNGFEITVHENIFRSKDMSWTVSGNFSVNKNKVKKIYEGLDVYTTYINQNDILGYAGIIREGGALGTFFTLKEDGYDEHGRIKYADRDANGIINDNDKFVTGHANPDFTYGLMTNLKYKEMELDILLQGVGGNNVFNEREIQNISYGYGFNMSRRVLENHWDGTASAGHNANAKYPLISNNVNAALSDRFIESGAYMRLKNISVSYNLPVRKLGMDWLQELKVYVSGQNLLTFTGYSGVNPEVSYYSNDANAGVDAYSYPANKSVTFGMRVEF